MTIRRILHTPLLLAILASLIVVGCAPNQPIVQSPTPSAVIIPATEQPSEVANIGSIPTNTAVSPQTTNTVAATSSPAATTAAEPTSAVTPDATDQPPAQANGLADLASLDAKLLPKRDPVSLAVQYGRTTSDERTARTTPLEVEVGQSEVFNLSDIPNDRYYTSTATLVVALPYVLMYVEDGVPFDRAALERSAQKFNDEIYPRNRELFGEEWSPGVDGDQRLTVLNGRIAGVGGYFSGSDEVPKSVNRFSNEREMFYINLDDRVPGTDSYDSVLAHEFQHMIEWRQSQRPTTWMNEGLSQLAEDLNGYDAGGVARSYIGEPDLQLTAWASEPGQSLPHYGASYLFLSYFYEQYGATLDLKRLIREGAGERLNLFAEQAKSTRPAIQDFGDVYADWSVANLLNDRTLEGGRYSYGKLPFQVQPEAVTSGGSQADVAQFGTDYIDIPAAGQTQVLTWDGSETVGLFAAQPEGAAWWSNRGDNAASVLTRTVDLKNVQAATLRFRLWHDIESDYDYGFVSASTDGQRWETLAGRYTTTEDPQGANYGNGYTGTSGGGETAEWVDEAIDLSPYAGQVVTLRFSFISDDAYNAPGMVIDNLEISEIDFRDTVDSQTDGWTTDGWQRTDNRLPQQWEVRLVRRSGGSTAVEALTPDGEGRLRAELQAGESGVLVISGTTPHTEERGSYTLTVN